MSWPFQLNATHTHLTAAAPASQSPPARTASRLDSRPHRPDCEAAPVCRKTAPESGSPATSAMDGGAESASSSTAAGGTWATACSAAGGPQTERRPHARWKEHTLLQRALTHTRAPDIQNRRAITNVTVYENRRKSMITRHLIPGWRRWWWWRKSAWCPTGPQFVTEVIHFACTACRAISCVFGYVCGKRGCR